LIAAPHAPSLPGLPLCRIYFNPSGGKPGILGKAVAVSPQDHPADWFEGLPKKAYAARIYTIGTNKYGVRRFAGMRFHRWEWVLGLRRGLT
jgi:hypothetical protein